MTETISLAALLLQHFAVERPVTPKYVAQVECSINQFGVFLGREARTDDLDELVLSRFLAAYESKVAPRTAQNKRTQLLTLWEYAADIGYATRSPIRRRVRKIRVPVVPPIAWTMDELRALLAVCEKLRGYDPITGVAWSRFFTTFIHVAYSTGLRLGDLLRLRRDQIRGTAIVTIQNKTGYPVHHELSPQAIEAIAAMPPGDLILPWPRNPVNLCRRFTVIVKEAGVRTGSTKWLRRSGATHAEKASPGAARAFLGHSTGDMWRRYVDPIIAYSAPPGPPPLCQDPNP